jgi:hypothetical protein
MVNFLHDFGAIGNILCNEATGLAIPEALLQNSTSEGRQDIGYGSHSLRRRGGNGRYWIRTSDLLGVNEALYH